MFPRHQKNLICMLLLCSAGFAQTQVDLRNQTKFVDFGNAQSTRPAKVGTALPAICGVGEQFFLSSAPAGLNVYACVAANTWALQSGSGAGSLAIAADGSLVGTRPIENFVTGLGLVNTFVDTGSQLDLTQSVNTAVMQSKAAAQAGREVLCVSSSGSAAAYTCSMLPVLTAYSQGMVLAWKPDVATTGAATLNIDTLGAVNLKQADGLTDPGAGGIQAGRLYHIWYDGTVFRVLNLPAAQPVAFGINSGSWEPWRVASVSNTQPVPQSGSTQFYEFTAPIAINVGLLGLIPHGNVAKHIAVAVFDAGCNLLAQSATVNVTSGTAVSMALGVQLAEASTYYLAVTSDSTSTSDTITTAQAGGPLSSLYNVGSVPRFFSGSTASWSGASVTWPATCGTKTPLTVDPPAVLLFK
jgi:hypothetical protein